MQGFSPEWGGPAASRRGVAAAARPCRDVVISDDAGWRRFVFDTEGKAARSAILFRNRALHGMGRLGARLAWLMQRHEGEFATLAIDVRAAAAA
ncbi:hypothetical protein JFK97_04875 [Chromobacterium phragmitis]|uniref:hypothetical protein n=1 Tax=Chromobacterium amazonense TaxID=1382803 RepID=UPI0021B73C0E|nr:hypothetical protein [Chromobacterium amazonense]MBM2883716.1 hypothetical protein [Chromobacterium amazonense]